jgi:type I restriction enzyme M protein
MEGEVLRGDSMRNPKFRGPDGRLKRFDIVVANPMWNQPFDPDIYENDQFGRFIEHGGITGGKADWAWLQHTLTSLKDNGRAAVVLDTGAVTRGSNSRNEDKERNIRRWFIDNDLIDGVILLPDNLFYNTTAAGVIVVVSKRKAKERRGRMVLVNASGDFRKGTPKNYIPDDAVQTVASAFIAGTSVEGFVAIVTNEDAAGNDFNISPSKYVSIATGGAGPRALPDLIRELNGLELEQAESGERLRRVLEQLV